MDDLPPAFLSSMQRLLGKDYSAFVGIYTAPAYTGLRVNTLKLSPQEFVRLSPYRLEPLPWSTAGFRLLEKSTDQSKPGKHPYHAAGLYYLQEPSAMLAAEVLAPHPGERVLDLAAAPGGKATHLSSLLAGEGLIVANDLHPQRVWQLAENLERWGVRNAIVLNETPERLAEHFGAYFDKILVDAPCSGEALFRKEPPSRLIWNPALVNGCAERQLKILQTAARMLKPGGRMVYSTCTFNPWENEVVIARFLQSHPDLTLIDPGAIQATNRAQPDWAFDSPAMNLHYALRIWPHEAPGEGHFVALLERRADGIPSSIPPFARKEPPHHVRVLLNEFIDSTFVAFPPDVRFHQDRSYLYHIPEGAPDLEGLRVIHPGWWIGLLKKDRFIPSHALALGVKPEHAQEVFDIPARNTDLIAAYLRGESLFIGDRAPKKSQKNWVLIRVDGFPLGWGRRVGDVIKNYYPRGLRWT